MKKILLLIFLTFLFVGLYAQKDTGTLSLSSQLNKAKTNFERFDIINKMCRNYRIRGINDSLQLRSQQLLELAQQINNDSLLIKAYTNVASYFGNTGNYPLTLQFTYKALNLAEKNSDSLNTAILYSNLGWYFILMGNFEEAVVHCKKAIKTFPETQTAERSLVSAYDNLSIAYLEQKKVDSSLYYTQLANSHNLKAQNIYEQSYIYYQFARAYLLLGENELAESYFRKSITYSTIHDNPEALSTAATYFCRMLLTQNRIREAKQFGTIGIKVAIASGMKRQAIDNAEVLRGLYEQQQQTDSAYFYSKIASAYRDSIFSDQKNLQIQNVIFSQRLHEIEETQQKENEAISRKHNLQYAAIAIFIIAFVMLFFAASRSTVVNERFIKFFGILGLLAVFEFINLYIHPILDRITNHNLLLMLAILMCIAALLIPLHHRMEKWITKIMVEKNKKIRLEAAHKTIATLSDKN